MEKHPDETAGKGNSSLKPILKKWKGLDRFTKVEGKVEGQKLKKRSMQSACKVRCRCCVCVAQRYQSLQDAVLKANASKHLNSAVDVKENLTSLLYERVWMLRDFSDHLRSSDHETVTSCYM